MSIEIWSDVVCPWCYIGKRRFEAAAEQLRDEVDLQIVYRPYQLDPTAPQTPVPASEGYAKKFGGPERAQAIFEQVTAVAASEGLEFRMDLALRANTLAAHRLLWLAEATGHQQVLKERLLRAYFTEGRDISSHDALAELAGEVGMPADNVRSYLASSDGTAQVREWLDHAADEGITAVPTYVIEGKWAIPGAQDTDTFVRVIRKFLAAEPA
jgi:predicted DsbA family dithiol-disulfide isomerase